MAFNVQAALAKIMGAEKPQTEAGGAAISAIPAIREGKTREYTSRIAEIAGIAGGTPQIEENGDALEMALDAAQERAAIMEYDGGLTRPEAEHAAARAASELWGVHMVSFTRSFDMGRPLKKIGWEQVSHLLEIQCTGEEIANVLGVSYDTLQRACKRENSISFAEYSGQKRISGKISLRRRQWHSAEKGNVTMLIWLGKQWLGQKNSTESEISVGEPIPFTGFETTHAKAC